MAGKIPNTLVVYDIPDDRKRAKIADACLDYGLDRIQFSAFLGWLAASQQEALMTRIRRILGRKPGNVQLFSICAEDWRKRKVIDQKDNGLKKGSDGSSASGRKDL
jgi:CRISPR-associated protein Cas2